MLVQESSIQCVLAEMAKLSGMDGVKVLAIDGRSAAGKSTLAEALSKITGAGLIHMDDFFLPPQLRTKERLEEAGGNVHYERFQEEVLTNIKNPNKFSYQRFDCSIMDYNLCREVAEGNWRIVEGSYSCHPILGEYMELCVFCDVSAEEQRRRIRQRNGVEKAKVFEAKWIPMEEYYFRTMQIKERANLIIAGDKRDDSKAII